MSRDQLARTSVRVLTEGQARSGAFVASPSFPVYRFAWLRDGAFCAHALDLVGETTRAAAFHRWVAGCLERHRGILLPARYTLEGEIESDGDDPWPNFQIDGYGMWLWSLEEHVRAGGSIDGLEGAVDVAARYLVATWRLPCYGCWEEFDDGEHAATVAAAAAGLAAAARLFDRPEFFEEAERARSHLLSRFVHNGRFRRCAGDERVDGSLLWLSVPFGLLPPDDPRIQETIAAVRRDLAGPGGGVWRYLGDTYYGGGQWLLLTCSLGWHDAVAGHRDGLAASRDWVRGQARETGDLPEQVTEHAQDGSMVQPWIDRWGPVATPLLWSHAMYLIMESADADPQWRPSL